MELIGFDDLHDKQQNDPLCDSIVFGAEYDDLAHFR